MKNNVLTAAIKDGENEVTMQNLELEKILNAELKSSEFSDYAPNGLQVEGRTTVRKIVTGVSASQALIDEAIRLDADAILVHHGYFWKNESPIVRGMKKNRLKSLLAHEINLYAYHLPLDAHPELGNNARLANLLGIRTLGTLLENGKPSLVQYGEFVQQKTGLEVKALLEKQLGRSVLHCGDTGKEKIRSIAWCTGGAQGYIELAAQEGLDAYVTGEVSEQTIHVAREMGIHFYAAGHHATERYGIKALGEWLSSHYDFDVTFVDIDNPA